MSSEESKTQSEALYERVKSDIISGALSAGDRLPVATLQTKYGSGATPLREAMNRLVGEGIVEANPQAGFSVTNVSLKDLQEVTRLRILLECDAVKQSIESGDDEWEANIVAAFYRLAKVSDRTKPIVFDEWERRNDAFHNAIVGGCTSKWLIRFRAILYDQHKRYRILSFKLDGARDALREHELIKDAVLARDIVKACELTRDHIAQTLEVTEKMFLNGDQPPRAVAVNAHKYSEGQKGASPE